MRPFDLDVCDLAFDSPEASLDGDPLGPFVVETARAWLVRPN